MKAGRQGISVKEGREAGRVRREFTGELYKVDMKWTSKGQNERIKTCKDRNGEIMMSYKQGSDRYILGPLHSRVLCHLSISDHCLNDGNYLPSLLSL